MNKVRAKYQFSIDFLLGRKSDICLLAFSNAKLLIFHHKANLEKVAITDLCEFEFFAIIDVFT